MRCSFCIPFPAVRRLVSDSFTPSTTLPPLALLVTMPDRQMQGDGFYDAIARFQHASTSSYLVLAWQTDTTPPLTPSPTRSNTLWEPTLKRSKSTNTLRIPGPQEIKTRHTYIAEGRLIGFNLQAVERYLSPGSCYHVLLRDRDAVVLIQQMAGASV